MQEELRLRTLARVWIRFAAVVVNEQLGEPRKESNQVQAAPIKPFANLLLGDRVPSFLNSGPHSSNMKPDTTQPYVPDANLQSGRQCRTQKRRDGIAAQRRLKCKIQLFGDCALEKSCSLTPSLAIRFDLERCGLVCRIRAAASSGLK